MTCLRSAALLPRPREERRGLHDRDQVPKLSAAKPGSPFPGARARHGLRHTPTGELRAEGVDIGMISKQFGHWSIATTAQYLDYIAPYAAVDAMRQRAW